MVRELLNKSDVVRRVAKLKMPTIPPFLAIAKRFNLRNPVQFAGRTPTPLIRFASLPQKIDSGSQRTFVRR